MSRISQLLLDCHLKVFSKCIFHCHCLCLCICLCICLRCCLFVGRVTFPHRSDQMSQRPKVSKIALWRCSLNVFVIVFVFVFVFVVVFLLVRSCFLITLIKCLKGQKSQRLKVFSKCICHCLCHCLCICLRHCLFVGHVFLWPQSILQGFGLVWKAGRLWIQHSGGEARLGVPLGKKGVTAATVPNFGPFTTFSMGHFDVTACAKAHRLGKSSIRIISILVGAVVGAVVGAAVCLALHAEGAVVVVVV